MNPVESRGKKTVQINNGNLLEVRDLHVSFPVLEGRSQKLVQAVRGVSFGLECGHILGIVGESGSGKSVSTSAIPGLLPVHAIVEGSIRYENAELIGCGKDELRKIRGKKIGMIFQEPGRSYDPLQNIGNVFFESIRNSEPDISKDVVNKRTVALLEEVGFLNAEERLVNFPHQFSGGQLQRIGIALALAQGCNLLIADEPTTALDVTIQAQIVSLLRKIRDARNISIIFISHNIDLVAGISDTIMVMYGGLVVETGLTDDIIANPRHPYSKALLAAAPRFGGHYSQGRLLAIPGKVPDPCTPESGCPFAPRCSNAIAECRIRIPVLSRGGIQNNGCIDDTKSSLPGTGSDHFIRCVLDPEYQV